MSCVHPGTNDNVLCASWDNCNVGTAEGMGIETFQGCPQLSMIVGTSQDKSGPWMSMVMTDGHSRISSVVPWDTQDQVEVHTENISRISIVDIPLTFMAVLDFCGFCDILYSSVIATALCKSTGKQTDLIF